MVIVAILSAGALAVNALGQEVTPPELTLEDAIALAVAHNASLNKASLETRRTAADLAANRTKLFPSSKISAQGGELLTKPSITFAAGSLGTYPATGPIPGTNQTITIPRTFVELVSASVTQPLTTEYKTALQLKGLSLGLAGAKEDERKQRLATIDDVRRAYYSVVEAQSQLDSSQVSLPYYQESKRLADEKRKRETILESDLLRSNTQLLQAQNSVSEAGDQLASATEQLNDLMGRSIHTHFRVTAVPVADADFETQELLETRALENRPDVKKSRLSVREAEYNRRAKAAEYIPEVNAEVDYYSTFNFGNTLPGNIAIAGFSLSWEPWDWGRKLQELRGKRAQVGEAKVSQNATERSALMEVSRGWRQVQDARRKLTMSEANQLAMRQQLQEVQEKAKREEKLPQDLFSAQSDLASADNQHVQALTAFWKARADLKKATGEE
jgi:outer membrane protein TolC